MEFSHIAVGPVGPAVAAPKLVYLRTDEDEDKELCVYAYSSRLRPPEQEYLAKLGYKFEWARGRDPHPHGICDVLRALGELAMWRLISAECNLTHVRVVEMSANILRTESVIRQLGLAARFVFRFVMPLLAEGDLKRAIARQGRASCSHTMQECTCPIGDILVGTHVSYYLSSQEMADAIERHATTRTSYWVLHKIDSAYGELCGGQLKYKMVASGQVKAAAVNNNGDYTHPLNDWHFADETSVSQGSLLNKVVASFGDVHVMRTTLIGRACNDNYNAPGFATWHDAFQVGQGGDATSLLSSSVSKGTSRIISSEVRLVPTTRIRSYWNVLYVDSGNHGFAAVSKSLVERLAADAIGQLVTPSLFLTLVATAKRILAATGCPDELRVDAATYAAVFALFAHLEQTTSLVGRGVQTHSGLIQAHNRAMAFGGIDDATRCARFAWWCKDETLDRVPTAAVFCGQCCVSAHETEEARLFSARVDDQEFRNLHRTRATVVVARPFRLLDTPLPAGAPLKNVAFPAQAEGCTVTAFPLDREKPTAPTLRPRGIVFSNYVPTTVEKTQDAAIYALKQRICIETPPPSIGAWECITYQRMRPGSILHLNHIDNPLVLTNQTVRDWIQGAHYGLGRIKVLETAWAGLASKPLNEADMALDGIIKEEKGSPDNDEYTGTTPRGVYSNDPRALVSSAPIIKGIARVARERYNSECAYNWASGETGLEIGLRHQGLRELHPDWVWLVTDQIKFEAHRSHPAIRSLVVLYLAFCRSPRFAVWCLLYLMPVIIRFGRQSIIARVVGKFMSGKADTSLGSILDNFAGVYEAFGEPYDTDTIRFGEVDPEYLNDLSTIRYSVDGAGDDDLVGGPADLITEEAWAAGQLRLGFETTHSIVEPHMVEFIRTRPYPSSHGWYFSVMIGRVLARLGWGVKQDYDPLAVACGLEDSTNHVPFVRKLIARMIALGGRVDAAPTHDWNLRGGPKAEVVPETWDFVQAVYGLTEDDENNFETLLSTVTSMPMTIHWLPLQHCLRVDDS
jgi:hypothetical protein